MRSETCERAVKTMTGVLFFAAPAQIFSKNHLMDRLFSLSEDVSENAIEVYVGRLRKKLAGTGAEIETVRSLGYRLVARP